MNPLFEGAGVHLRRAFSFHELSLPYLFSFLDAFHSWHNAIHMNKMRNVNIFGKAR